MPTLVYINKFSILVSKMYLLNFIVYLGLILALIMSFPVIYKTLIYILGYFGVYMK